MGWCAKSRRANPTSGEHSARPRPSDCPSEWRARERCCRSSPPRTLPANVPAAPQTQHSPVAPTERGDARAGFGPVAREPPDPTILQASPCRRRPPDVPALAPGQPPYPASSTGARGGQGGHEAVARPAGPGVAVRLTLLWRTPHRLGLGLDIPFTQRLAAPPLAGTCRPCLGGPAARLGPWAGPPERLGQEAVAGSAPASRRGRNRGGSPTGTVGRVPNGAASVGAVGVSGGGRALLGVRGCPGSSRRVRLEDGRDRLSHIGRRVWRP